MNKFQLHDAIGCTSRVLDYVQPTAEDFKGCITKLAALQLRKTLLQELAATEAVERSRHGILAVDKWNGRQKDIEHVDKCIQSIHDLLASKSGPTTTQENS